MKRVLGGAPPTVIGAALAGVIVDGSCGAAGRAVERRVARARSSRSAATTSARVSASTGTHLRSTPLAGSPERSPRRRIDLGGDVRPRDRVEDRHDYEHGAADDPDARPRRAVGAHSADGYVWVADTLAGTVSQIDPRANGGHGRQTRYSVGNDRRGSPTGTERLGGQLARPARSCGSTVDRNARVRRSQSTTERTTSQRETARWVIGETTGGLSRIDRGRAAVVGTTNVGNEPAAVAVGPTRLGGERGRRDRVEGRPSTGKRDGGLPGRRAAERDRCRRKRPRLGGERRLGDAAELDPGDGPRGQDRHDRRASGRSRAGRRHGVRSGAGAAERAPRRHAHDRRSRTRPAYLSRNSIPRAALTPPAGRTSRASGATHADERRAARLQPGRAAPRATRSSPTWRPALPTVSDGGLTYTFQLRQRDPLLDRRGGTTCGHPPRDRTRAAREQRPGRRATTWP